MSSPRIRASILVMLLTTSFMSRRRGCITWRRLKVNNWRVNPAARSAAWMICWDDRFEAGLKLPPAPSSDAWPWITVRILLKSCATPPASWPIASIFWACRN